MISSRKIKNHFELISIIIIFILAFVAIDLIKCNNYPFDKKNFILLSIK